MSGIFITLGGGAEFGIIDNEDPGRPGRFVIRGSHPGAEEVDLGQATLDRFNRLIALMHELTPHLQPPEAPCRHQRK